MALNTLIEPELLRRLELLSLNARRAFSSTQSGDRRSRRRGLSVEFSDYREYRSGDDLRYVDWKAYGRLEKMFIKLFQDEEDLTVHLLIDSSKSMSFGEPISKWDYARRAAAAIGFIALHENSRVDAAAFGAKISERIASMRGDSCISPFLDSVERMTLPSGPTDFVEAVKKYSAAAPPAGMVFIFSDFFGDGIEAGIALLAARRHQVTLVQILDPSEIEPDLDGEIRLIDSETGESHDVSVTEYEIDQYRQRLAEFTANLTAIAKKYSADYLQVSTDTDVEGLVLTTLRSAGVLM